MTNYSLTVAAATRAGIGPKSPPLLFMTALKTNQIDNEAHSDPNDTVSLHLMHELDNISVISLIHHSHTLKGFDSHNFFVDPGVATLPPLKVSVAQH